MLDLELQPGRLTLSQLRQAWQEPVRVRLAAEASAAIERSVACVRQVIDEDRTVYGINTGFGLLAQTRIAREDLELLQRSLVLSHATGIGDKLPIGAMMQKGLTIKTGQTHVQKYLPELLQLVLEGKIDTTDLISHRLPLEQAPEAYKNFHDNPNEWTKVVLKPHA